MVSKMISPPDDFDVADATCPFSWVLATRGGRGGGAGRESLGSSRNTTHRGVRVNGFFWKHDGCAIGRNNSAKKYGTPTNKVSLQTKSGAGNTMVMSELTGGADMMGLIVFLII